MILREVIRLRAASKVGDQHVALAVARLRAPVYYDATVTAIALTLVRQPLHRLQRTGVDPSPTFLYDDSWMHDTLTTAQLAAQGGAIELYPGVAWSLARLSGLLKPALEVLWVDDVRRWNKGLVAHVPDIAGHLFGRDRVSLAPARVALLDAFGATCFYCGAAVGSQHLSITSCRGAVSASTDWPISWWPAARCNTNKSQILPATGIVERVVTRDRKLMERMATELGWPTQLDRVVAAARGLYRGQPPGTPLWSAFGRVAPIDLAWTTGWLLDLAGA